MDQPQKYLLVVGGPTASGKTSLAIALARHFTTEILSADSRQFYREMRIGNARPDEEELSAVPHHFIADRPLTDPLSAGEFAREAEAVLTALFKKHDHVVLVGGSGLFIRALTEGLDEFPEVDPATRQKVRDLYEQAGLPALQAAVRKADPDYYAEVDQRNPVRLQRALEVCWSSGKSYSSFRSGTLAQKAYLPIYFQPTWPREQLYARINLRVEHMIAAGLEAEAKALAPYQHLSALQTVGYQEWWPYFTGEKSPKEVIQAIQQNSRRYAKRQLTWNRRDGHWKFIPAGALKQALAYLHLVKEEGLMLKSLQKQPASFILHPREQRKGVALVNAQGKIKASVEIVLQKEWAYLQPDLPKESSCLSQVIIMHEVVYRTERNTVYVIVNDQAEHWLKTLAWKKAEENSLPKLLRERSGNIWCWKYKTQM